jgi:hypothetical protein
MNNVRNIPDRSPEEAQANAWWATMPAEQKRAMREKVQKSSERIFARVLTPMVQSFPHPEHILLDGSQHWPQSWNRVSGIQAFVWTHPSAPLLQNSKRFSVRKTRVAPGEGYVSSNDMVAMHYAGRSGRGKAAGFVPRETAREFVECGLATWGKMCKFIILKVAQASMQFRDLSCTMGAAVMEAIAMGSKYHLNLLEAWR